MRGRYSLASAVRRAERFEEIPIRLRGLRKGARVTTTYFHFRDAFEPEPKSFDRALIEAFNRKYRLVATEWHFSPSTRTLFYRTYDVKTMREAFVDAIFAPSPVLKWLREHRGPRPSAS